jgi:antitoxin component of MazEF toxin-antitoxin module
MVMHLHKWGNSLGLRVPAQFIKQLQLSETDALEMIVDITGESLIVRRKPSAKRKKYNLKTLLSKVKPEQLTEEAWDEDSPRGREVW